ncbi:hypothetical protein RB195_022627 [Necator americanus]|uniref:Uncharacterized protein n=1 Tax=Necator americanus TaxID=51031 RepID=A0ABR1EG73_NECAM
MNKIDDWGSLEAEGKIFIMTKPQHDATFSTHEQNRWLGIFGGRGKNIHNDEASTRRYLLTHEQSRWLGIFGGRGKNIHNDEASTRRYLLTHEQNRWLGIFRGRGKNINNDESPPKSMTEDLWRPREKYS